jgi:hypothetical protein
VVTNKTYRALQAKHDALQAENQRILAYTATAAEKAGRAEGLAEARASEIEALKAALRASELKQERDANKGEERLLQLKAKLEAKETRRKVQPGEDFLTRLDQWYGGGYSNDDLVKMHEGQAPETTE